MHFDLNGINLPIHEIPNGKKIIIYGVGDIAEKYTELIGKKYGDNKIEFYLVSEINTDTKFHEKEILSFEKLKELEVNDYYYIIASFSAVRTMKNKLYQYKIKEENIHETVDFWSVEVMREIKDEIKDVYFYPKIEAKEQLSFILNLMKDINIDDILYHASIAPSLSYREELPLNLIFSNNSYEPNKKDFVLIWNVEGLFDSKLDEVKFKFCVDKTISESITAKLINCLHSCYFNKKYLELSKRNWKELIKKYKGRDSLIFGNGPSLDWFLEEPFQMDSYIKVVCNQMYINKEAMDKIKPNIYLLYDHAYFMEENIDSLEYILKVIRNYDCYLIVPLIFIHALIFRKNIDQNKLIGIDTYGSDIEFVTEDKLQVRRMYSVITTFGVPIASYLSSVVYFVGCDGKKLMKNGEFFWPYAVALKEETENIKGESVSRESNEMKLGYEQHCNEFEKLVQHGKKQGKLYYSFTKSYIPILSNNYKNIRDEREK